MRGNVTRVEFEELPGKVTEKSALIVRNELTRWHFGRLSIFIERNSFHLRNSRRQTVKATEVLF